MKLLFDDESFPFETLRTAGFAAHGGADLGEVLATARHIGEGDEAAWHQAWKATAALVSESNRFVDSSPGSRRLAGLAGQHPRKRHDGAEHF